MTVEDLLRQDSVHDILQDLAALGGAHIAVLSPAGDVLAVTDELDGSVQPRLGPIGAAIAAGDSSGHACDAAGQCVVCFSAPVTCAGEVTATVVVLPRVPQSSSTAQLRPCASAAADMLTRLSHAEFEMTCTVRELATTYEELAAVYEASELMADTSLSLHNVAQIMLRRTAETINAMRGAILLHGASGVGPAKIVSTVGMNAEEQTQGVAVLQEWLQVAKGRGWLQPVSYNSGLDKWPDAEGVPLLVAPLATDSGHMGAIALARPNRVPFSARDAKLLAATARQTAMAVKNKGLLAELQGMFLSTVRALAAAIEHKDPYTRGHSDRVAALARSGAAHLELSRSEREGIHLAGLLHDVGKIGVSEQTLRKHGPLSDEQWAEMREHPVRGADIVSCVPQLAHLVDAVRHHHERYDGGGYPDGLRGDELSPPASILCVCDAFDAMTSERSYRPRVKTAEEAYEELRACAGTQFHPDAVNAVLSAVAQGRRRSSLQAAG